MIKRKLPFSEESIFKKYHSFDYLPYCGISEIFQTTDDMLKFNGSNDNM